MDGYRFDHLTKKLAEGRSRRSALKMIGAAIGSGFGLLLGPGGSDAAVCRPDGTSARKTAAAVRAIAVQKTWRDGVDVGARRLFRNGV